MTPLSDVPLNSLTWLAGSLACFALCYRSFTQYRHSANELSKYLACFSLAMGIGQAFLAVPAFFTLNVGVLRSTYQTGELFIYISIVAQAAIVWCLVLRSRLSLLAMVVPVSIIGLASWLYALPRSALQVNSGAFIIYKDPLVSTIIIGVMLIGLFLPVGFYFLRAASQQAQFRGALISLVLGMVYIGIGILTGVVELVSGEVITPSSARGDLTFFLVLLAVLLWPRRIKAPHIIKGRPTSL
jgi:hypothetical protein